MFVGSSNSRRIPNRKSRLEKNPLPAFRFRSPVACSPIAVDTTTMASQAAASGGGGDGGDDRVFVKDDLDPKRAKGPYLDQDRVITRSAQVRYVVNVSDARSSPRTAASF